ncbi:hypothetical protein B0H14DRAFT_2867183, partial [Mycena olivaceomarginata]
MDGGKGSLVYSSVLVTYTALVVCMSFPPEETAFVLPSPMYPATILVWRRRGRGCQDRRRSGGQKNGTSVCCGELLGQSAVDNTEQKLLRAMRECFLLLLGVFDRAGVLLGKGRGARSSQCNGVRRV